MPAGVDIGAGARHAAYRSMRKPACRWRPAPHIDIHVHVVQVRAEAGLQQPLEVGHDLCQGEQLLARLLLCPFAQDKWLGVNRRREYDRRDLILGHGGRACRARTTLFPVLLAVAQAMMEAFVS